MVYSYKELIGSEYTDEALLWADTGYEGWPDNRSAPRLGTYEKCQPCGVEYDGPQFTFDWFPDVESDISLGTEEYLDPYVPGMKEVT